MAAATSIMRAQQLVLKEVDDALRPFGLTFARDGLVRRVGHDTDRRKVLAELTDEGRKVVEAATKAVTAVKFGLGDLTAREADALTDVIRGLRRRSGDFED
jgi:hypothetical protein